MITFLAIAGGFFVALSLVVVVLLAIWHCSEVQAQRDEQEKRS